MHIENVRENANGRDCARCEQTEIIIISFSLVKACTLYGQYAIRTTNKADTINTVEHSNTFSYQIQGKNAPKIPCVVNEKKTNLRRNPN